LVIAVRLHALIHEDGDAVYQRSSETRHGPALGGWDSV
jgi:hypothetical protein